MTTIYIVVASGGSYDDAWQANLCARFDKTDAELEVLRLEEQSKKIGAMIREVEGAYRGGLHANQFTPEVMPRPPSGPAKSDKESMKLHAAVMKAHYALVQPIAERNQRRNTAAMLAAKEAAKQKAIELGANEDDLRVMGFTNEHFFLSHCRDYDCAYFVEELTIQ